MKIKVFSAPHLSTPCCLAEPLAEHEWASLPRTYWHLYDDASKVVNHLKERVPKVSPHCEAHVRSREC